MPAPEHHFVTLAARRLHALVWPCARPAAPPLVCVHGLTRVADDFVGVADALAATRTVVALDMAGRGASDWLPDPALYNYATYLRDCGDALARLGMATVDWLGTSMGGLIGLLLAAQPPAPSQPALRKLVLNDIGPFIPQAALARIGAHAGQRPFFADLRQAQLYCLKTYASFGIHGQAAWDQFTRSSVRAADGGWRLHYDPGIAAAFAAVAGDVALWELYDAVRVPTLVLRGETSDTLLPATAAEMTRRGPRAALVTLPGYGHAPALLDAEQIAPIQAFLDA